MEKQLDYAFSSILVVFRDKRKRGKFLDMPGAVVVKPESGQGYIQLQLSTGRVVILPFGGEVEALLTDGFCVLL